MAVSFPRFSGWPLVAVRARRPCWAQNAAPPQPRPGPGSGTCGPAARAGGGGYRQRDQGQPADRAGHQEEFDRSSTRSLRKTSASSGHQRVRCAAARDGCTDRRDVGESGSVAIRGLPADRDDLERREAFTAAAAVTTTSRTFRRSFSRPRRLQIPDGQPGGGRYRRYDRPANPPAFDSMSRARRQA